MKLPIGWLALGLGLVVVSPGFGEEKSTPRAKLGAPIAVEARSAPSGDVTKVDTGILVVPVAVVPEAPGAVPAQPGIFADASPFKGRLSLRSDVGDGVGYKRGFTYLEGMIPLIQDSKSLLFADVRVVDFDRENRWEYNVGAGYRWFSPLCDRVLGVNAFYDSRKTDSHFYQQLGVGFEALSPTWEFRTNGYLIIGPAHRVIGDTGFVNVGVFDNNVIFQRRQSTETALGGGEVELGRSLPVLERFTPRVYGAFYTYSAEGLLVANGVRARLEAQLTQRISLHAAIQHDQLFRTTATGGLAISFGAPSYRAGCGRPTWDDVMRQRVNRDVNIVIHQGETVTLAAQPVLPPPPPPPPVIIPPDLR